MNGRFSSLEEFYRATYGEYLQEVRVAAQGAKLLRIAQPPGDFSDAPVPELVISMVTSPSVRASIDLGAGQGRFMFTRGSFILTPPSTPTQILVDDPHSIVMLALARSEATAMSSRPSLDFGPLHQGLNADPVIHHLIESLAHAGQEGSPSGRLYAESAIATLVARLDHLADRGVPPRSPHRGGLSPRCLRRVTALLMDRLAEDVPLAVLAAEAGLSPFHFARAFRASTGMPPHRWLMAQRIELAKRMLGTGTLSVGDVAAAVGYADPGHLAKLFRRETGMSPAEWRRERHR